MSYRSCTVVRTAVWEGMAGRSGTTLFPRPASSGICVWGFIGWHCGIEHFNWYTLLPFVKRRCDACDPSLPLESPPPEPQAARTRYTTTAGDQRTSLFMNNTPAGKDTSG